jgi:hypothetical protein
MAVKEILPQAKNAPKFLFSLILITTSTKPQFIG